MSQWTGGPEDSSGASFAARLRLCRMPQEIPPASMGTPDDVLDATRRLHAARLSPSLHVPSRQGEEEGQALSQDLADLDLRLGRLLDRLGGSPVMGTQREVRPAVHPEEPKDALALVMLQRARGYFDEWRILLLEEQSPARQLQEFAASPYVDLLERHHPRLGLLLDGEGRLLRLMSPQRLPGFSGLPLPGTRLDPLPVGERLQVAWEGLAPFRWTALGGGLLLVREEDASGPLPEPLR
jgi:hypothetical protein